MRLAYQDDGSGPAVVLLHGFPLDHTMWDSQRDALGDRYRVITPDLRGHGKSPAPLGAYTMEEMAADVAELLDTLGVSDPIVLGGLSMGGYVALAFAAGYLDRLRGLMLFDTRATADTPQAAKGREETACTVEAADSPEPVVAAMIPKLFAPQTLQEQPELVARFARQMRATAVRGIAGALRGMALRPDRTAELARMKVPALVVVGSDDAITPPPEAHHIADRLPGARLVEVPQAGHMAPVENPQAVQAAVLEFLASLP